jgi:hypothetical protein
MQLDCANTDAIVVSTLAEAYYVINSHLVTSGKLKDVLFGFPVSPDRFDDVYDLSKKVEKFCIFIGKCLVVRKRGCRRRESDREGGNERQSRALWHVH